MVSVGRVEIDSLRGNGRHLAWDGRIDNFTEDNPIYNLIKDAAGGKRNSILEVLVILQHVVHVAGVCLFF